MPIKHEWNGTILTITSDSGTSSADLQGVKGATGARGARGLTGRTGGGALIEDGVIRDDTTWSSAGIMDRFAEAFSTEGNPVVCNNALANVPFNIITEFEPKQEGSGNPYPAGGGKNLFDKNNYTPLMLYINYDTKTYISYTDERTVVIPIKPNTTYTVKKSTSTVLRLATSIDFPTKNGVITSCVRYDDDGKRADALTITSGSNDKWLAVQLFADSSKDTEYYSIPANIGDLQVEEGSAATAYEPYSNIRSIVGYDSVNITRSGKNLFNTHVFDKHDFKSAAITTKTITDNSVTLIGVPTGGYCYIKNFKTIECAGLAGKTLTVSATISGNEPRFGIQCYNKDDVKINDYFLLTTGSLTFTLPDDCAYLGYICYLNLASYGTEFTATYSNIQLEVSETATAYEPYKGEIFTMSLGNTYAQGTLDWNTGELVVDKKYMVLTGNEALGNSLSGSTQCIWLNHTLTTDMAIGDYLDGYCSHFYNERKNKNVNTIRFGASADKTIYFYLPLNNFADASAFNAYAKAQHDAGTPIQIVYPLAEPQIIKLEPQIIKALSGTNTLLTNADNLLLVGRIDTMKTIQELLARVSALEAKVGE